MRIRSKKTNKEKQTDYSVYLLSYLTSSHRRRSLDFCHVCDASSHASWLNNLCARGAVSAHVVQALIWAAAGTSESSEEWPRARCGCSLFYWRLFEGGFCCCRPEDAALPLWRIVPRSCPVGTLVFLGEISARCIYLLIIDHLRRDVTITVSLVSRTRIQWVNMCSTKRLSKTSAKLVCVRKYHCTLQYFKILNVSSECI